MARLNRPSNRGVWILHTLLISACLWAFIFAAYRVCFGAEALLPCVTGESKASAEAGLAASGFTTVSESWQYSDTVQSGLVISESPACSQLYDTGTVVDLVLSLGSVTAAGQQVWGQSFSHILYMFGLGVVIGLFIKVTNRS